MRKHLVDDFDLIYVLDLGGNIRKGQSGAGNVFGIRVGVSINLFVRLPGNNAKNRKAKILYFETPDDASRADKFDCLNQHIDVSHLGWRTLQPDRSHNWFPSKTAAEFRKLMLIGGKAGTSDVVFRDYSLGISTNRDSVVYDFEAKRLAERVEKFADDYNSELERWRRKAKPPKNPKLLTKYVDDFVNYDFLKWSRNLKRWFKRGVELKYNADDAVVALYRPFVHKHLHFARMFVDEVSSVGEIFPPAMTENRAIVVPGAGNRMPFGCCMTDRPVALDFAFEKAQIFALYTYGADGKERRDNIPLTTRDRFGSHYKDDDITREHIFYYIYGVLHHPDYRARYAENLKRELPRVPMLGTAADFHALADAGRKLADLHVGYEAVKPYPLQRIENPQEPVNWRVESMKLSRDERSVVYNKWLTLDGIPPEALDYRLGNRSALGWVIDQYRVARDDGGEIVSDPNPPDDEEGLVRLVGQIVAVSVETMKIIRGLPALALP